MFGLLVKNFRNLMIASWRVLSAVAPAAMFACSLLMMTFL